MSALNRKVHWSDKHWTETEMWRQWRLETVKHNTETCLYRRFKIFFRFIHCGGGGEGRQRERDLNFILISLLPEAVPVDANNTAQNWNITGLHPGRTYRITLQLSNAVAQSNETVITTALPQHCKYTDVLQHIPILFFLFRSVCPKSIFAVTHNASEHLSNKTIILLSKTQ